MVEFAIKFKELVPDQVYLTVNQKCIFLMQHVEGHPGLINKQKWLHPCIKKTELYL